MLNRLGLVIHWAGFLVSGLTLVISLSENIAMGKANEDLVFISLCLEFGGIFGGWLINFILTGHRSPLPWVANKEANSER